MLIKIEIGEAFERLIESILIRRKAVITLLQEIKNTMATKEELEAGLDGLKRQVGKIGGDLAAHLADLNARIEAGQDLSGSLSKIQEISASLQAVDDTIPEQPETPAPSIE